MAFKPSASSHLPADPIVSKSTAISNERWADAMGIVPETPCKCGHCYGDHPARSGLEPCQHDDCRCLNFRKAN